MALDAKSRKYVSKFKRGQMWWIPKSKEEEDEKMKNPDYYLKCKSRPWIILNDPSDKRNSFQLTVVPTTSVIKNYKHRVHIYYDGKERDVVCDEVQTMNFSDFDSADYMATFHDDAMGLISDEVARYLKVSQQQVNLSKIEEVIENIITEKANKILDIKSESELTDDIALDIAAKIESIFKDIQPQEISTPEVINTPTPVVVEEKKKPVKRKTRNRRSPNSPKSLSVTKSTKEEKIEFLRYLDKNGTKATMKEYNYAYSSIARFKKLFLEELASTEKELV